MSLSFEVIVDEDRFGAERGRIVLGGLTVWEERRLWRSGPPVTVEFLTTRFAERLIAALAMVDRDFVEREADA